MATMAKARKRRRYPIQYDRLLQEHWPWLLTLAAVTVLTILVWRYGW